MKLNHCNPQKGSVKSGMKENEERYW